MMITLPAALTHPTTWATPPDLWSYTALRKARACPRSSQLERSRWAEGQRLPEPLRLAPLAGQLVHSALEHLLRVLVRFGLPPRTSPDYRKALRHAKTREHLETGLAELRRKVAAHPRAHLLRDEVHLHELADQVASLLERHYEGLQHRRVELLHLTATPAPTSPTPPTDASTPNLAARLRRDGVLSEARVQHATLRLHGILDAIYATPDGPVVADFKTGAPYATHRDQLALYALLWRSATGDLPCAAEVVYASHTDRFTFSHADLDALEADLHTLIDDLDRQLAQPALAAAHPGEPCTFCPARSRCDAFWQHRRDTLPPDERLRSGITPLRVLNTLGPYAFLAATDDLPEVTVTLASQAPLAIDTLRPDQPLRVLNARWREEENALEITPWTEVLG